MFKDATPPGGLGFYSASEAYGVVRMLEDSAQIEMRERGIGEIDVAEFEAALNSAINIWLSLAPGREEGDAMQILTYKMMGCFSEFLSDAAVLESLPRKRKRDGH